MAFKSIEELKKLFETGDYPAGSDFSDLIDSCYNNSVSGNVVFNDLVEFNGELRSDELFLYNQFGNEYRVTINDYGNISF